MLFLKLQLYEKIIISNTMVLIQLFQGPTEASQIFDPRSLPHNFGGALGVGWCKDTLPLPGKVQLKLLYCDSLCTCDFPFNQLV